MNRRRFFKALAAFVGLFSLGSFGKLFRAKALISYSDEIVLDQQPLKHLRRWKYTYNDLSNGQGVALGVIYGAPGRVVFNSKDYAVVSIK